MTPSQPTHRYDLAIIGAGSAGRVAGWSRRGDGDLPLDEVVGRTRLVEPDDILVRTAQGLGIYIGDLAPG